MSSFTQRLFKLNPTTIAQKALVSLPRVVPDLALRYTSPEGPQPFKVLLPARTGSGRHIPVYIFVPEVSLPSAATSGIDTKSTSSSDGATIRLPVVLDFHGGGFFMGSCLEQAPFCALLARELSTVVISVDYRMGPIDKFPAAIEDGEDVLSAILDSTATGSTELIQAIQNHVHRSLRGSKEYKKGQKKMPTVELDRTKVAVSGFSSGSNIALNLGLSIPFSDVDVPVAWPSRFPLDFPASIPLLLFYPSLDCSIAPSLRERPADMLPGSPFWGRLGDNLQDSYLPSDKVFHPRASPGLPSVSECLHPKAKCLLILPGEDNLAVQSEVWVKKVNKEGRGGDLRVERYPRMKHGWTQFPVSFLGEAEKQTRIQSFNITIGFVRAAWEGRDPVTAV